VALWEKKGSQPKIADRFIRSLYREKAEGNAHIVELIEHLIDSDLEEHAARITFTQGDGVWKLAA